MELRKHVVEERNQKGVVNLRGVWMRFSCGALGNVCALSEASSSIFVLLPFGSHCPSSGLL